MLLHGQVHGLAHGIQQQQAVSGLRGIAQLFSLESGRLRLGLQAIIFVGSVQRDDVAPARVGRDAAVGQQQARAAFGALTVMLGKQAQRTAGQVQR